jgi:hypothetical protein
MRIDFSTNRTESSIGPPYWSGLRGAKHFFWNNDPLHVFNVLVV